MAENLDENIQKEIDQLKAKYDKNCCKVIKNVGEFIYVVTMRLFPKFSIKFQLPERYPSVIPEIIICSDLKETDNDDLKHALLDLSVAKCGDVMLDDLIQLTTDWSKENLPFNTADEEKPNRKNKCKKKKNIKNVANDEVIDEKKPSMKTASDVISRIMWDDEIKAEYFIVGYLDRFVGLIEKPFDAFSWEDLSTVDYTVLAIPKHRIEYFKYKDLKVWDKVTRMDNVFGSTGKGTHLREIIQKYEANLKAKTSTGINENTSFVCDDKDDISDDDINIRIDQVNDVTTSKEHGESKGHTLHEAPNTHWLEETRPTHFLAVRITDPEICQTIGHIQDVITETNENYQACCVPQNALHVTLCTLHLSNDEKVAQVVRCLQENEGAIRDLAQQVIKLNVSGVTTFHDNVLYASVSYSQDYVNFLEYIKQILNSNGINIRDNHDHIAHVTIMKISRPAAKLGLIGKNIHPSLYSKCKDTQFGQQIIEGIILCSMSRARRVDGFYTTPYSLIFNIK